MSVILMSNSSVEWVKVGDVRDGCFVGKEVFCVGSGCHLVFYDLVKFEETIYRADNAESGEGVGCFAGHKTLSIFAFAEKCPKPRIFVLKYPEFTTINIIYGYELAPLLRLHFSEEFLFSLESYPAYRLTIWYWRTTKMLDSFDTQLNYSEQALRCNYGSPVVLGQLAIGTRKMFLWEVNMSGKKCIILKHKIHVNEQVLPLKDLLFSPEGGVFTIDIKANVYMLNNDYELERVITRETRFEISRILIRENPPDFIWFKGGIVLATAQADIKHYVKKGDWVVDWEVDASSEAIYLKRLFASYGKDYLVGIKTSGDMMLFDNDSGTFTIMKEQQSNFNEICMINPVGEYVATLAHQARVCIWEIATGKLVVAIESSVPVHCFGSNPVYPYIAMGLSDGHMVLRNAIDPTKLPVLTVFNLTMNPLSSLYFHESGRLLVTVDKIGKHFFVIEGIPGSKMQVIAHVEFERTLLDYILVPSTNCLRLFVLFVTEERFANVITRYCLVRGNVHVDVKDYKIEPPGSYVNLYTSMKFRKDRFLLAMPLLSKMVHEFETKRADPTARRTDSINTAHQMCNIHFYTDKERAISYAYDGFIMVRSTDLKEIYQIVMPHHRNDGGVQKAQIDGTGKYLISLGHDNTLVCTSLDDIRIAEEALAERRAMLEAPELVEMFSRGTTGFELKGRNCNWLQYQKLVQQQWEAAQCRVERKEILRTLTWMKDKVSELLTLNLEGPENELLPVQDFELNVDMAAAKMKENEVECEELRLHFLDLIDAQDKVSQWIITNCWEKNLVQAQWLYGILSEVEVSNFVVLKSDAPNVQSVLVLEAQRRMEINLAENDVFEPWQPKPQREIDNLRDRRPTLMSSYDRMKSLMEMDVVEGASVATSQVEEPERDTATEIGLYGANTLAFVTPSTGRYKQQQLQTFGQFITEAFLSLKDTAMMREGFNVRFEALVNDKKYEMNQVRERNDRLRHIISELNYFSATKIHIIITDPQWRMLENPENIIKVNPSEVSVTPYISPSEQEILDKKAAEAERLRLLLLADDFRERALMAMMNGVLEIRWEDELRKDVPKPKVMLSDKDPEDYDENDLKAIKAYEEAVEFLESERRRYLGILDEDYKKVGEAQREAIRKFNARVAAIHLDQLKVASADKMEHLKLARKELYSNERCKWFKEEEEIFGKIHEHEQVATMLQQQLMSANEYLAETKASLETLLAKDRQLEKIFKKDFNDHAQLVMEQCWKIYKKRGKLTMRGITSTVVLHELAKCIITNNISVIVSLSNEAMEFVKGLDALDQYLGIVPMVDENTYAHVCRYRRLKIESELRTKIASLEVAEGELTIATIAKHLQRRRDKVSHLQHELQELRKMKVQNMLDMEQQICIKRGLVELPTSGCISDFDEAILICRGAVETINRIIQSAGDRKIRAMENAMTFRRDILKREWEHKFYQMEIESYKTQLHILESVKVTKEVQTFLKFRARGITEKQRSFEEEVEQIKASYVQIIEQIKVLIADVESKIHTKKREMARIDRKIFSINIDVCECNLERDVDLEKLEEIMHKTKMENLRKRSALVKQIQEQHKEILVLKTELELLKLKTYPTLKYSLC